MTVELDPAQFLKAALSGSAAPALGTGCGGGADPDSGNGRGTWGERQLGGPRPGNEGGASASAALPVIAGAQCGET
jgi:hypothetical protein